MRRVHDTKPTPRDLSGTRRAYSDKPCGKRLDSSHQKTFTSHTRKGINCILIRTAGRTRHRFLTGLEGIEGGVDSLVINLEWPITVDEWAYVEPLIPLDAAAASVVRTWGLYIYLGCNRCIRRKIAAAIRRNLSSFSEQRRLFQHTEAAALGADRDTRHPRPLFFVHDSRRFKRRRKRLQHGVIAESSPNRAALLELLPAQLKDIPPAVELAVALRPFEIMDWVCLGAETARGSPW
jgi:hypothetical protein